MRDSAFGLLLIGGDAYLSMGPNDYLRYDRASDEFTFNIAAVTKFGIGPAGASVSGALAIGNAGALQLRSSGGNAQLLSDGDFEFRDLSSGASLFRIGNGGVAQDGSGIEFGYRDIPIVTAPERGKCASVTAGQSVGPAAAGDVYHLYNNSGGAITIDQSAGVTLRLAGTTATGNRTLAPRGFATLLYVAANEAIVSGPGLS